ncbi:MAG: diguanylate cyclase [Spirochaetaceae bacterium]|nr:diguanylate cyclase [Spirochaetaceae bacterium]
MQLCQPKSVKTLALVMMDVDHFKKFNDSWGHPEGDRVLMAMGPLLSQGIRDLDFACRYGGGGRNSH